MYSRSGWHLKIRHPYIRGFILAGEKPRSVVFMVESWTPVSAPHWRHVRQEAAALRVNYGQRTAEHERWAFERICDYLGIKRRLAIRNEALGIIGGSALTDDNIEVPVAGKEISARYLSRMFLFRNAHFLAAAVSWAEVLGAEKILYWRSRAG